MKNARSIYSSESISNLSFIKFLWILLLLVFAACGGHKGEFSRGVGIYPGDANEHFGPTLKVNTRIYKNLALNRASWHSSSYDYNLTAQLITDGIIDTTMPLIYSVETSEGGMVPKNERGYLFDRHPMTGIRLEGSSVWVSLMINRQEAFPAIDSVSLSGSVLVSEKPADSWEYTILGSQDGENWDILEKIEGKGYPGEPVSGPWKRFVPENMRFFNESISLNAISAYRLYKLETTSNGVLSWNLNEFELLSKSQKLEIGGPYSFTSAWMSEGTENEWVYTDLKASCRIDSIVLHWINPASDAQIEISDDARNWSVIHSFQGNRKSVNSIKLDEEVRARYIRLSLEKSVLNKPFLLSELQVFGIGAPIAVPKNPPSNGKDGLMELAGLKWTVQRASEVPDPGSQISKSGYNVSSWLVATVPSTVLMSYYNAGALPDPNFGDNQLMISESFFYSDFWYRNEFYIPKSFREKRVFLNFDGINWKAEIFLNGEKIGNIDGAFMRGKFDVTDLLNEEVLNVIAVKIIKNHSPGFVKEQTKYHPGSNGGELGRDNPTFHASVGWDWIPTIRGRNMGIWNDVYLNTSGDITIEDPFLSYDLPLPDTTTADVRLEVELVNHSAESLAGKLVGKIGPIEFDYPVELEGNSREKLILDPDEIPALRWKDPILWWPNGYGNPHLYDVELAVKMNRKTLSDVQSFKTGVREMSHVMKDSILYMYINGRRFSGRGGNWGFSESNLRYRGREYDIAVNYHKDMHFTMIRNWVGQTGDKEFYEACDRNGIMIWQDFWLANPVDGPNPFDNELFMSNARDYVKKIRNHPSLALYCGRNEGNPPEILDTALHQLIGEIHSDLHYISHSSIGVVSGFGPYRVMPVEYYFRERALPRIHSEIGMPNIVNLESIKLMMPDSALWPQERMWGMHDFCLNGAQGGSSFKQQLEDAFGPVDNVKEWVQLAQWINYRGYRAIFEAQSKYRMGLLLWMSHPAWPSLVWQTYDYYFDPTAAYFACKKASAPIHILWNALTDSIEVMNTSYRDGSELTARIELLNIDGSLKYEEEIQLSSPEDSRQILTKHPLSAGLSKVYFLRLKLLKQDIVIAENLYWRALENEDYSSLRQIPDVEPKIRTRTRLDQETWILTTVLTNDSSHPALMVHASLAGKKTGIRLLPALFSDNYLTIMPGESVELQVKINDFDTQGERPVIILDGINIK